MMTEIKKKSMKNVLKAFLASAIALGAHLLPVFAESDSVQVATGQLIVHVAAGTASQSVSALADRYGCDVLRPVAYAPGYYVFAMRNRDLGPRWSSITPTLRTTIDNIASEPAVTSVGPNAKVVALAASVTPNDPLLDKMWGLRMIRMPEAWVLQSGDPVKVADLDTGVDATHEDFKTPGGDSVLVDAANFTGDALGPDADPNGHGSHTSGTIGAVTDNGKGVPSVAGWQRGGIKTTIMPVRVLGADGSGSLDQIVSGIEYAITKKARVINMSLGVGPTTLGPSNFAAMQTAVNDAVAAGIVVVCSAGNSTANSELGNFAYPADFPGVIKVSAVGPNRDLAYYSSYGAKPNTQLIAAPGGDLSLRNGNPDDGVYSVKSGGGYVSEQGTSMSAPHVSGLVALMLAAGVQPKEVYPMLARHAQKPGGTIVYDPVKFGAGIIDAYETLLEAVNPIPVVSFVGVTTVAGASASSVDRGVRYFSPTPIQLTIGGAYNIVGSGVTPGTGQIRQSDIKVEVYRIGDSSPYRTYVGGTDFLVPSVNLNAGDQKYTKFTVDIPSKADNRAARPGDTGIKKPDDSLPVGQQYKIVAKVSDQIQSIQFVTIAQKSLPAGRSLFALPFRAGLASGVGNVENLLLGTASTFSLARYNPLRLPSEEDYARYRSNGSVIDPAARFLTAATSSGPLTYDISDPSTSLAPIGVGYWLDLASDTKIDTARLTDGRTSAAGLDATNAVAVRVFAAGGGWNMIGAPFTYPIEWSSATIQVAGINYSLSEAVANGILSPVLVGYDTDRRDYAYAIAPNGVLQPFNAYWIRVYKDATVILPPRSGEVTRAIARTSTVLTHDGWKARLIASVAGDQDGQNYFGQVRGGQEGVDSNDIPKPPAGSGHAYVRFESTNGMTTRSLATDLRGSSSTLRQEWRAGITSDRTNAEVSLSWEGLRSVPRRYKVSLRDESTGQLIAMQSRASYTYQSGDAGSTRYFRIVLEPQLTAGSLVFTNVRTTGGTRAESGMTVRFLLNQEADVIGTVRTLSGKSVATLSGATRAQAGAETALHWSGRAQDGTALPAGPYVLDVTARAADGTTVRTSRTIQHLR